MLNNEPLVFIKFTSDHFDVLVIKGWIIIGKLSWATSPETGPFPTPNNHLGISLRACLIAAFNSFILKVNEHEQTIAFHM